MKALIFIFTCIAILGFFVFTNPEASAQKVSNTDLIKRGQYLVKTTGCNDCHTPGYGLSNGKVPESEWLIGDQVGWHGPWGTTYPTNLRQRISNLTEEQWISYAKNVKARPPMPWFTLNEMTNEDLRAMYYYVKSLGPNNNKIPNGLPPGEVPKTPYLNMNVVIPKN